MSDWRDGPGVKKVNKKQPNTINEPQPEDNFLGNLACGCLIIIVIILLLAVMGGGVALGGIQ